MRPSSRTRSRAAWLPVAIGGLGLAFAFGCSQLIGADGERALATAPSPSKVDAGDLVAPVPDAGDPDACPPGEKRCNSACVPKSEPGYGCGAESCTPCSLANTAALKCTAEGLCASGSCTLGFRACGAPTAGCTSDMTDPATCGSCEASCQVAQVCNPAGCGATCDVGLTQCGQSCVDTLVSPQHCGPKGDPAACTTVCKGATNGDPTCANGKCVVTCRAGFFHCDGNPAGPCTAQIVFYKDSDGDGWGDVRSTKLACNAAEAGPGWSSRAGDCKDTDKNVFPGQAAYFSVPYVGAGGDSWDYNCDGVESEMPGTIHFVPCDDKCMGKGIGPLGSGRKGPGVDDYCGSVELLTCNGGGTGGPASLPSLQLNGLAPQQSSSGVSMPACAIDVGPIPPNPCH